ncbi:hypothetical protein Cgig2_016924 [Carnegiea gigantea]|uniref:Uncharacterized protein n=1 Tax=Carnegiea gigantea TaxID=171969 RepID=A0A9Q1GM07_9CARY|nr:hypothetical protein Cgig2_016924 [Carnegiea gigantea]
MQDRYRWAAEHASVVKEAYWDKGKNRLKDMVCKVGKKKPTDMIPSLSLDVRRQLQHHKQTSTGFLKRSRQYRLNKVIGPKAGTCHIQRSGSASAIAKKTRIAGEIVTAAKLFSRTHTKGKDKIFADDRSKAVWEKYQSLKMAKEVPPSQEDGSLFLEAVGGTVYGLGNSAGLFYEKPVHHITSKMPSYTPSIVFQLQSELESTKTELNSTKNELNNSILQ